MLLLNPSNDYPRKRWRPALRLLSSSTTQFCRFLLAIAGIYLILHCVKTMLVVFLLWLGFCLLLFVVVGVCCCCCLFLEVGDSFVFGRVNVLSFNFQRWFTVGRIGGQNSSTENIRQAFSQRQEIKKVELWLALLVTAIDITVLPITRNLRITWFSKISFLFMMTAWRCDSDLKRAKSFSLQNPREPICTLQ